MIYSFWNNKGGTGKTTLAFQVVSHYAAQYPQKNILMVDMCPQANVSEVFLGGQINRGADRLSELYQSADLRHSIGGYFTLRLRSPFIIPNNFKAENFVVQPHLFNQSIPENIDLIPGDILVENQSVSINNLAFSPNAAVSNPWAEVMNWLADLILNLDKHYDTVFIDTNPSFSIYTQIAIANTNRLIVPVTADDSSRRALLNVFSLIYGIGAAPGISSSVQFINLMQNAQKMVPKIHVIVKNRLTQYMGDASAYAGVLQRIESDIAERLILSQDIFTFNVITNGIYSVRDFHTTGVASFAYGIPFHALTPGKYQISDHNGPTQITNQYIELNRQAVMGLVNLL